MSAASDTTTARPRLALFAAGIALAVFLIAPRTSPGLAGLLTGLLLLLAGGGRPRLPASLFDLPIWLLAALAFGGWMLISVIWSVDRVEGGGKVAIYAVLIAALWLASNALPGLNHETQTELLRALVIAFGIAAVYLCLEELTQHAIKRSVFSLLPWTRPSARHMGLDETGVARLEGYISNRNMAALSLALWPVLLAVSAVYSGQRARLIAAALAVLAALVVARSQHESSAVALLAGALVLSIAFASMRIAASLAAAGWIVACLLVVPVTDLAYRQGQLHLASWLPHTAKQRIILWGYTAAQVADRPLHGVGIASTKPLDDARRESLVKPQGHVYELRTGPHAHNAYLQTWYELGGIGALLFMVLGLAVLRHITQYAAAVQPWLLATFTTASLIGAFTWGMWQAWFMGAFAFAALLAMIAARGKTTSSPS